MAFIWSAKAPNSTSSPEHLTGIIGMAIGLSCILAGALFWLIIEEVPRIVKEEQDGLRPRFIILCYIVAQLGTFASAAIAIKLTAWISRNRCFQSMVTLTTLGETDETFGERWFFRLHVHPCVESFVQRTPYCSSTFLGKVANSCKSCTGGWHLPLQVTRKSAMAQKSQNSGLVIFRIGRSSYFFTAILVHWYPWLTMWVLTCSPYGVGFYCRVTTRSKGSKKIINIKSGTRFGMSVEGPYFQNNNLHYSIWWLGGNVKFCCCKKHISRPSSSGNSSLEDGEKDR